MTPPRISASARAILDYVTAYMKEHGYSPTVREICEGVGLASTSTVHGHLQRLKTAGLLTSEDYRTRTMRLNNASDEIEELRRENRELRESLNQLRGPASLLADSFSERNGAPLDGFRFREEMIKLRKALEHVR